MQLDRNRLKAAVHYICRNSPPEQLGAVKLHKILWLADMGMYGIRGAPMTGESYKRYPQGPFSTHLAEVLDELSSDRKVEISEIDFFGKIKKQYLGVGQPDISLFNDREISMLERMRKHVCEEHTATSISEFTHDDIWEMASEYEVLPYHVSLVSRYLPINEDDIAWAKEVAQEQS